MSREDGRQAFFGWQNIRHGGLTRDAPVLILFSMTVETIGDAYSLGWRVMARCTRGREDHRTHSRECSNRRELDIETLCGHEGETFRCLAWKAASSVLDVDRGASW